MTDQKSKRVIIVTFLAGVLTGIVLFAVAILVAFQFRDTEPAAPEEKFTTECFDMADAFVREAYMKAPPKVSEWILLRHIDYLNSTSFSKSRTGIKELELVHTYGMLAEIGRLDSEDSKWKMYSEKAFEAAQSGELFPVLNFASPEEVVNYVVKFQNEDWQRHYEHYMRKTRCPM